MVSLAIQHMYQQHHIHFAQMHSISVLLTLGGGEMLPAAQSEDKIV